MLYPKFVNFVPEKIGNSSRSSFFLLSMNILNIDFILVCKRFRVSRDYISIVSYSIGEFIGEWRMTYFCFPTMLIISDLTGLFEQNVNFSRYNKNESQHSISDNSRLDVTLTHPELRLCYWPLFDEGERDTALIPVGGLYIEITDILQHHQPPTKGKELNFTQPSNILSTNHK